ncbi:unnamed protein product [Prorocentrum cordatum]|uniref:Uncharacterized protein n=1 Tax=Prorocentrum cordatum TaxID=2364126 RepID=A0ABN9WRD4_9DINO|nr:unnamed protein product [Polarella glacialis]
MQSSLQASVRELALGVYSQPDRFLLECVQNADDCDFEDDVEPQLHVTCRPGEYFWMQWNERGFQPEDVRAVCDIAKSTKRSSARAATGCKGLGFKSYFLVSGTPHVLSLPFLFRFDAAAEVPLPHLTPWPLSQEERQALPRQVPDSGTAVYLPVRDGDACALGVPRLPPVVMLFLRRLRLVSIWDVKSTPGHETRLRLPRACSAIDDRREEFDGGLEVSVEVTAVEGDGPETFSEQRFLLFRSVTADGVVEAAFPRRAPARVSETAGAAREDAADALPGRLGGHGALPLCVTLPVADLGFAFAINGDFELVASREEVDRSLTRNLSLRRALTALWLRAVGGTPELRGSVWDLLPGPVSNPFWAPFVAEVSREVHSWPVLPTSTPGELLPASQVLRPSPLSRALELSGHRLRLALGMDFLADDFAPSPDTRRACKPFGLAHLLCYLESSAFDPSAHGESWRDRLVNELLRALEEDRAELPLPLQDVVARLRRVGLFRLCGSPEADWAPADGGGDAGRIFTRCSTPWRPACLRVLRCEGDGSPSEPSTAEARLLGWLGGGGDAGPRDVASAALLHSAAPCPTDLETLLFLRDHWVEILEGGGSKENSLAHLSADDVAQCISGAVWLPASEGHAAMRPDELLLPMALGQTLSEDVPGSRGPRVAVPVPRPGEGVRQDGSAVQETLKWELLLIRLGSRLPRGGGGRLVDLSRVLAGEDDAEALAAEVLEAHRGCGSAVALRDHASVTCLRGGEARLTVTSPHVFAEEAFGDFADVLPLVRVSPGLRAPAEAALGIRCSRDAATAAACLLPGLLRPWPGLQPPSPAAFARAYQIVAGASAAELRAPVAGPRPGAHGAERTVVAHLRDGLCLPGRAEPLPAASCVWQSRFEASAKLSGWVVLEPLFGEDLRALFVDKLGVAPHLSARDALRALQAFATEDGQRGGCYTTGSLPWIRKASSTYLLDLERALERESLESIAAEKWSVPILSVAAQWVWCSTVAPLGAPAECVLVEDAGSAPALEVAIAAASSAPDPIDVRVISSNVRKECPLVTRLLNLTLAGDALQLWLSSSDPITPAKRCFPKGWPKDSLVLATPESSHKPCGLAGVTSISVVDGLSLSVRLPTGGGEVEARWPPGGVVVYGPYDGAAMLICRGCLGACQLQACVARALAALVPPGGPPEDACRELVRAWWPQKLRDATATAFPLEVPAQSFLSDLSERGEKQARLLRSPLAMIPSGLAVFV